MCCVFSVLTLNIQGSVGCVVGVIWIHYTVLDVTVEYDLFKLDGRAEVLYCVSYVRLCYSRTSVGRIQFISDIAFKVSPLEYELGY